MQTLPHFTKLLKPALTSSVMITISVLLIISKTVFCEYMYCNFDGKMALTMYSFFINYNVYRSLLSSPIKSNDIKHNSDL